MQYPKDQIYICPNCAWEGVIGDDCYACPICRWTLMVKKGKS